MKKRILAILLAGLLTASAASCISREGSRKDSTGLGGTEDTQTSPSTTEEIPPVSLWENVNDYIYTTEATVSLRTNVSTVEGSIKITGVTKLHRVKTSSTWSQVEYNNATYYIHNDFFTTDDLLGETFTACVPPETMYATSGLNIRKYASATASASVSIGGYKQNDEVTVVSKGDTWYKVKFLDEDKKDAFGFVKAEFLSKDPVQGPVTTDYSKYFDNCDPKTVYVAEGSYNLRYEPHKDGTIRTTLIVDKANPVITLKVTGTGTGDYIEWVRVSYPDDVKEGDPQTYTDCYIHKSCLKENLEDTTLEGFLSLYPDFAACEELTLYVLATTPLNARKTPVFEGDDNIGVCLNPKTKVKVVARGMVGTTLCYVIEYQEGVFYFVSAKYLTPNESGEPAPLTLTDLLAQYKTFTACTATDIYAKGKVNCYNEPKTGSTVPFALEAGNKVSMVAKSSDGVWCIIETSEGKLYFAGIDLFTEIAPAG